MNDLAPGRGGGVTEVRAPDEFAPIFRTIAEWSVLRCSPGRTIALAATLANRGAWTPTWTRRRRLPRSPITRPITEACIPTFVFIPAPCVDDLPTLPRLPYTAMRFDGALVKIPDRQLEPLRSIADKPLIPAHRLPRPGQRLRFTTGPFEGLFAKVLSCTQRYATVSVDGFALPLQVPPCILQEKGA